MKGAMVLSKMENLPLLTWPVWRVIEIIHSSEGVASVVIVKTSRGE